MDDIVFVQRDADGKVQGVYGCAQPGYAEEQVSKDSPEIQAYYGALSAAVVAQPIDPLQKLKDFLAANPDVAKLIC